MNNTRDNDLMWQQFVESRQTDTNDATQVIEEKAKPDFLDADGDGDKKEPMKKALKDKESKDSGGSDHNSDDDKPVDEDKALNEHVTRYVEQSLADAKSLGRQRWFREYWTRDRALLESLATDPRPHDGFPGWSSEDFWAALVGVEREFYGLSD